MIGNARFHRPSAAQSFLDAPEVVPKSRLLSRSPLLAGAGFSSFILRTPPTKIKTLVLLQFVRGVRIMVCMRKKKLPPEIRDYFVRMGKLGGALGGKARAENLTPQERSDSARRAVTVRWQKAREHEEK